jgi:hypothetical protein
MVRSRRAHSLAYRATHAGGPIAWSRRVLPKRLRRRAIDAAFKSLVFEPAPALDPELAAQIRSLARPQVEELGTRLGRDLLEEWGYRHADKQVETAVSR